MGRIRGNVLIIEDDLVCGELALQTLIKANYGVRWVQNREQAAFAMLCYEYDYALINYTMAGMSIEDFTERCKIQITNVILISEGPHAREHAARLGITHWLAKPFTAERLMEVMSGLSSGVQKVAKY